MFVLPLRETLTLSSAASHPGGAIRQAADAVRGFVELAPAAWPGHRVVADRAHRQGTAFHLGPGIAG